MADAGELDEDDLAEGGFFVRGEGVVDLFEGAVDFVEERDAEEQGIEPVDQLAAEVISSEAPHQGDEQHGYEEGHQAPVPIDGSAAAGLVGPTPRQEEQQCVGDVRHGAEQPDDDRNRNHSRQNHGQAGEEIGAPVQIGANSHIRARFNPVAKRRRGESRNSGCRVALGPETRAGLR